MFQIRAHPAGVSLARLASVDSLPAFHADMYSAAGWDTPPRKFAGSVRPITRLSFTRLSSVLRAFPSPPAGEDSPPLSFPAKELEQHYCQQHYCQHYCHP